MKFGIALFPTDYSIQPVELAQACEARGFESLWFPEHSHIPASRRTPFPGGGELPKMYYDVYEPFISLGAAAAVTRTLKLATGVCLVVQRDPIQTAKDVATLDRVSNGRFLFGVGVGWNAEEMENHGTSYRTRLSLMEERIAAMKAIWTQPKAEYHGKLVHFDPIMTWPKPVQKPHPPVLLGGGWPGGARRAIAYGNGWMPIYVPKHLAKRLPEFWRAASDAGRARDSLELSIFAAPSDQKELEMLRENGASRAVFMVPPDPAEKLLPRLDSLAELARRLA
ncbi:MAG TPA: LLM class F420-dependent oxidoreductase [Myxococcota bacterium]|nr:LLM class F420-dependent oxidoreductase [Myxococcota bacterium]